MLKLAKENDLDVAAEQQQNHPRNLEDDTWTNIFTVHTSSSLAERS